MQEIATVPSISPRTVAFQKYETMVQLELATTAELVQYAVKDHIA